MQSEKNNSFVVTRTFDAPQSLVWKVHTESEHLAKWWGPAGFKLIVCELDLRPGGLFHYGMEAPDGGKLWGRFLYHEIIPIEKMVFVVSFSDEKGGIANNPFVSPWPKEVLNTLTLSERNGKTTLTIIGTPINSTEEEEQLFANAFTGMNQGFNATYDKLDELLSQLKN